MSLGLKACDLKYIIECVKSFDEIEKVVVFGSRAKGNYKLGSDVDLAIYGDEIDFNIVAKLHYMLEEQGPLPYMFDVVNYSELENKELKEHIDRVGKVIFSK